MTVRCWCRDGNTDGTYHHWRMARADLPTCGGHNAVVDRGDVSTGQVGVSRTYHIDQTTV